MKVVGRKDKFLSMTYHSHVPSTGIMKCTASQRDVIRAEIKMLNYTEQPANLLICLVKIMEINK